MFLASIKFTDHTCCHCNHTKYDFYKNLELRKQSFYHNSKTIKDIITIFSGVWDIYPGIISVKFCAILPQKI